MTLVVPVNRLVLAPTEVTIWQAVEVVVAYMKRHPERLHLDFNTWCSMLCTKRGLASNEHYSAF